MKAIQGWSETSVELRQLDGDFSEQDEQGEQAAKDAGLDTADAVQREEQDETTRPDDASADRGSEQQDEATTRSKL